VRITVADQSCEPASVAKLILSLWWRISPPQTGALLRASNLPPQTSWLASSSKFDAFDCARFDTERLRSEADTIGRIAGMTIASTVRRGDLRNIAEPSQRFAQFARAISTIDKFGQAFYVLAQEYPLTIQCQISIVDQTEMAVLRAIRDNIPDAQLKIAGAKWFQRAGERLLMISCLSASAQFAPQLPVSAGRFSRSPTGVPCRSKRL
jgi:hypothetical protein